MKLVSSFLCCLLIITTGGCVANKRFVKVSEESLAKSVSIQVTGIIEVNRLVIRNNDLDFERSTMTVTYGGSGVFVSPNSQVLTCAHLFDMQKVTGITVCDESGECTAGQLTYHEDRLDLALIKSYFDFPTPYATLADSRKLRVGDEVIAIGSPLGLIFTVTHGIISAFNRDGLGVYNMTQSDAFLNPGNSGGPLFNLEGELVGINSRVLPPVNAPIFTGLGFSVSTDQISEFLVRYKNEFTL